MCKREINICLQSLIFLNNTNMHLTHTTLQEGLSRLWRDLISELVVLKKLSRMILKHLPKSSVNLSCNSSREENKGVFLRKCVNVLEARIFDRSILNEGKNLPRADLPFASPSTKLKGAYRLQTTRRLIFHEYKISYETGLWMVPSAYKLVGGTKLSLRKILEALR